MYPIININYLLYSFVQPWQLIAGVFVFMALIAGMLSYTFLYLFKRYRRSAYKNGLRHKYQDLISFLAISENEEELKEFISSHAVKSNLDAWLKESYARHILIKELVIAAKSMNGIAYKNLCWFYAEMGLEKDTLEKLKSHEWHIKAKAIQTLSHLGQKQFIARIYRFTNSNNEFVRHEARIAVVKLTGFEGLRFLDVISYPLTEWQQIHLLHELSKEKSISSKDVDRWLQSANHSVAEFALRLVEVYRIYDLHDEVIKLLKHPEELIRIKAINALCEIQQDNTAHIMVENFRQENNPVQMAILKALQKTGTESEIPFLSRYLLHEENDFKMAAARAIRNIKTDGLTIIERSVDSSQQPWPVLLMQLQEEDAIA